MAELHGAALAPLTPGAGAHAKCGEARARLPAFVAAQKDAAEILEAALAPLVPAAGALARLKGGCGGAHAPRSPRKKEAKEPTRSRPVLAPACGGARALAPAAYKDAAAEAWKRK